jgi:hypothetical protein
LLVTAKREALVWHLQRTRDSANDKHGRGARKEASIGERPEDDVTRLNKRAQRFSEAPPKEDKARRPTTPKGKPGTVLFCLPWRFAAL